MDSLTIYKQWETILFPANRKGNQNDENEEPQKVFQKLQIRSEQVTVVEVSEDFQVISRCHCSRESEKNPGSGI